MGPDPLTHLPRGEAGSVLIEAIVSAAILLAAIVSLFVALDVQTASSGNARASTAAAALAEKDQERLRSFRIAELSNRRETQTVPVAGEPYTVVSRADWIRDDSGAPQKCTASSTQGNYLRVTSTVTGRQVRTPLQISSLVSPPAGAFDAGKGTLAIKTIGGMGQPVQGATTSITGPTSLSDNSNATGCAVFGFVPVGSYTVKVKAPGFVDPAGNNEPVSSATATQGTTNVTTVQYDQAGSVAATFDTKVGAAAEQPSSASALTAANPGVPATGFRLFKPASPQTAITAAGLFPFSTPYTLYSGSCASANPATYNPDYFAINQGSVVVGAGSSVAVALREPALQLRVKAAAAGTAVTVRAKSTDVACTELFAWPLTAGTTAVALPDPGVPFGRYNVCVQAGSTFKRLPDVDLTKREGSALLEVDLASGATGGTCVP